MAKNLGRLACKFDLDQSERKPSQVNASTIMVCPNGVARRSKFSTYVYWRLRLARTLDLENSQAVEVAKQQKEQ